MLGGASPFFKELDGDANLTNQIRPSRQVRPSRQSSSRGDVPIERFIIHRAAATSLEGVADIVIEETRRVSANYVVGQCVIRVIREDRWA